MKVTKEFLKDIKSADSIVIRFKGEFSEIDLFYKTDAIHDRVVNYQYGNSLELRGNWHCFLWPRQLTPMNSILSTLRVNDEIRFTVEYNGNQYLEQAGLNAHQLILTVSRNIGKYGKRLEFVFDSQYCPNNSALNMQSGVKIISGPQNTAE